MQSVTQYLSMGGYATFVWPAFAVCAVVMGALVIASRRALARERRVLDRLDTGRRERGRAPAEPSSAQEAPSES